MRTSALALLASVSWPIAAFAQATPPADMQQPSVNLKPYQVPPIIPSASAQPPPAQDAPIMAHPTGTPAPVSIPPAATRVVYQPPQVPQSALNPPPAATQPSTSTPVATQTGGENRVPSYMPPTISPLSPNKPLRLIERRAVASSSTWFGRVSPPAMQADGRLHFNGSTGEPFVVCSPLHVCDIALPPGEIVNPPLENGDPRWMVNPGISGAGFARVTHLFVKPTDAGLSSNLIVATNKRVISIRLSSQTGNYMPLVAIDEEPTVTQAGAWGAYQSAVGGGGGGFGAGETPCDQAPSIPPSSFKIERDNVLWRPVQAYAVSTPNGPKTCIQFPASIGSADLPAVLLIGPDGGFFDRLFNGPSEQIVNYRYVKGRFELDRLIDQAVLVSGVGRSQERVRVTRLQP